MKNRVRNTALEYTIKVRQRCLLAPLLLGIVLEVTADAVR